MEPLIHLYETFSEAMHTVQELEAVKIAPENISLIVLNGKSSGYTGVERRRKNRTTSEGTGTLLQGIRGRFFAGMALHIIPGLDPVAAGGWIVTEALMHTKQHDEASAAGLVECLVAHGLAQDHAETYVEGIRHGQALLGVKVIPALHATAKRIMCEDHNPLDPRMRGRNYQSGRINSHELIKAQEAARLSAMLIGDEKKN